MPNIIDLYAGAGGMSLGAARAGFNVAIALELDNNAILSHSINFPNTQHLHRDINDISGLSIIRECGYSRDDIVGIIGGPPCQGFSTIGHGKVDDERNSLFVRFFQIVAEVQPLFFIAENVPGIMKEKYCDIRSRALGYVGNYTVLPPIIIDASEYGAPTCRTRYFFVGYRNDSGIELTDKDFYNEKCPLNERTTVKKALEGLPTCTRVKNNKKNERRLKSEYCDVDEEHLQSDFFYEHATGLIPEGVGNPAFVNNYIRRRITNGFIITAHSSEVVERFKKLKPGQFDSISKCKKLDPDDYCPTLRAGTGPDKGSYQAVRPIHYKYARVINPREAARLQGFPDWYKLPDTIWHSFRQLGNSVSPIAAEAVLKVVYDNLPDNCKR